MQKINLSQMKELCTSYFFSRATMKFFKGCKYKAFYIKETGTNYLCVSHRERPDAWYIFMEDYTFKNTKNPFMEA